MGTKLSIDDFDTNSLSSKALALISECALILYRHDGILIDVSANDAAIQVLSNAKKARDHRTRLMCLHIRTELINNVIESKYQVIHQLE